MFSCFKKQKSKQKSKTSAKAHYWIEHSLRIDEVASKISEKEDVGSLEFSCQRDPASPTFSFEVKFGSGVGKRD